MSALINIVGKKFGKITVKERFGSDKHRSATWLCDCDCGNKDLVIVGTYLTNGITKSCKKCIKKDLLGQRFGRLLVSEQVDGYHYECICDCGNKKIFTRSHLIGGVKSCGCLRHEKEDLSGMKFGMLTVIKRVGENNRRSPIYLCRCDCGKEKEILAKSFKYGGTKSCGCLNKKTIRKHGEPEEVLLNNIFLDYVKNAQARKRSFEITKEEFKNIIDGNCFYCGSPPSNTKKIRNNTYVYNGIDRIDNSIGYEIDNCVSCCKKCNMFKCNITSDEFLSHVETISKYQFARSLK
jgi:hypothetical protein